ncbi:hypothetical protein Ahy_B01g054001 [Arachis hypogaea]|uniref:Protein FAR1-RELATED SEQUENCE n=1 Tax=Arachis hypogaea TaxID=3818 RepID=A0A445AT26_ARAHY|nr:hypothetical protein Ahy_B01g054001 [Arachis hypogaea]
MMHGFAVRLDEVRRDSDGCVIMRQIVCNRVGSRKEEVEKDERIRDHQPLNRSCCLARIRARLDRKIHKWKVVSLYEEHSHGLFEVMWGDMVARYNLSSNCWVDQTYKLRNLWALAYLRNQFFRRIRTTSQCEGINFLIKVYVRKKDTLLEFINNMETVVSHYRNNERDAEFNSKYTDPELVTSLPALDGFAAKNFTHRTMRELHHLLLMGGDYALPLLTLVEFLKAFILTLLPFSHLIDGLSELGVLLLLLLHLLLLPLPLLTHPIREQFFLTIHPLGLNVQLLFLSIHITPC